MAQRNSIFINFGGVFNTFSLIFVSLKQCKCMYNVARHFPSFVAGHNGYRIFKSIPYGSIADTLPYLARRAQENKAILANARRERALVGKALKSRMFSS